MKIIESIRTYIKSCPYLKEYEGALNVDFLGKNATSYSIEEVPVEPIIKRYVDGSSVRQCTFIFCSRELLDMNVRTQLSNSGFYEDFANWLEEESVKGNLPILAANKESRKIEAITSGYVMGEDATTAQYQIQCRLTYFQGRI
jgi:hypothetical protein